MRAQEGDGGKAVSGDLSSGHRVSEPCCSGEVKRNRCLICSWLALLSVPGPLRGTVASGYSVRALPPLPDLRGRGGRCGDPGTRGWRASRCQLPQVDPLPQSSAQAFDTGMILYFRDEGSEPQKA